MNNFYKLLRCAALMVLTMAWMMPAMAQHPFTLTTQAQHDAHSGEALYWIETNGATGFYMIPMDIGDDKGVSTSNMPNERMLWYFMDAGIENTTQYYYIVNKSTGRYLRLKGANGADGSIGIKTYASDDSYKFSVSDSAGQWVFSPKSGSNYYVNKKGTSVNYANGLKSSTTLDDGSKWNFVAKNDVTWAHPFTNSVPGDKHYYLIQNRHSSYTSFYLSTDALDYVTVSEEDNDNRIWYFVEASSNAEIPNMKYYYIVNAVTGKYMYFDGSISGISSLSNVFNIKTHPGGDDNRYQFAIVNAVGHSYSAFAIMPKYLIGFYQDKYTSVGSATMSNNERTDTRKDRGYDDNDAHWVFETTVYSAVDAPTVTNNYDGTITLSTTTEGATIYYTTNGDTPDNTSTEYSSSFSLGDAIVIKAVACLDLDYSVVTTYNVPRYTKPTVSFDSSTSQVTITSGGTVYYNTGDGTQAAPTPSSGTLYSAPFTVSPPTTVKAIATHAGYLTSFVETWDTDQGHVYSQDYLTFNVLTGGTISWKSIGSGMEKEISYSINDESWTAITAGSNVTITVNAGDVVRFKGLNSTYAQDKSNYSGFDGGTATYDIAGNIMSLIYGDDFVGQTTMTGTFNFCSLFKQSKAVSAKNLILPATSLTESCYRSMFSKCVTLKVAPALPATTLANDCYSNMFEECAIASAPVLPATTLVSYCYAYMFTGCTSLNYLKCLAVNKSASGCLSYWVKNVAPTGTFEKNENASWNNGVSAIPSGWVVDKLPDPIITCDGEFIMITCQTYGASIYYRLGQTGSYSLYLAPVRINENTSVEAYAEKDELLSEIVRNENCIAVKTYKYAGMTMTSGPLYYGSNGYEIKDDWHFNSYNSIYGKAVGSTYFNFIELGQLFEKSEFSTSDGDIDNVLDPLDGWRIPTKAEWASILGTTRSGSTVNGSPNQHYAMIQLSGVSGLLIFPDGETITGETLSNMDNPTSNTITEEQLNDYLDQGCIFLPGNGYYDGSLQTWSDGHHYWSSTENNSSAGYVSTGDSQDKASCYFPVFLVKAAAYETTRLLKTWTYNGNEVELPYSVNAIDGHSGSYDRNTFNFTTDVMVKEAQPTYLWFQHADQSANIYVNNSLVDTHWGGYNAFFTDITNYIKPGLNDIRVTLNNTARNTLAPNAGDFNFNATLGEVKLISSPVVPAPDYGYDGFHITSTVTAQEATITVKTSVPTSATLTCSIKGENCDYTSTQTGSGEITFTHTITEPHLWNGTLDPYLYDVTLTIAKDGVVYHEFKRGYGLRFYAYVDSRFMLNGSPYLLRGVCMHHDLEGKANALNDDDIANDFAIIQDLGCNFIRLAHYPHPKEVYDWCDKLGIIVQTEVPCVNNFHSTLPDDYYTHLGMQYADMVNQHYNHPCILFWGLANEITTNNKAWAKTKLDAYRTQIKGLDPERWVGFVVAQNSSNPSYDFNNPAMDWFGCNIYVGWYKNNGYSESLSNNPSYQLDTRISNIITDLDKPLAYSEYGCGGTQHCHSEDPQTTTTRGTTTGSFISNRHDIEYQMWLHEGHIASIKDHPELLFTSQWQLFDIAVYNRNEGYTICLDGENTAIDDDLRFLNNKGLVERDHKTKKDTYYLYKAWWNENNDNNRFVHICGKDYEKLTDRVIKCYTNDGSSLSLFVNNSNTPIETVDVTDYIATFTATDFHPGDVIRVEGATTNETYTFPNIFTTDGNWNVASNWRGNVVPDDGGDAIIRAECTIPDDVVAQAKNITIDKNGSLTIADGGQLILPNNTSVQATVQNSTVASTETKDYISQWNAISSPVDNVKISDFVQETHNVYRYDEKTVVWQEYRNSANAFAYLQNGRGYLYRSTEAGIEFKGDVITGDENGLVTCPDLSYACENDRYLGFNLIGNPFTHDITWANLTTKRNISDDGFFLLGSDGEWAAQTTSGTIAPMQAFMIQATDADPVVKIANSVGRGKGNDNRYGNDHIQFTVNNSEYSDVAYAIFKEGYGLNKIEHRNADIPMLYIINNNQDYAIAAMPDNTKVIDLGFDATKMGQYTLSIKGKGKYSYMHLYDKITDSDVDMLLGNSYTFIGSSSDRKDRFVLRLNYNAANIDTESDIFAYQSGNDIIVSGEGELQIFDVTGRPVMTTTISGVETINVPTMGVYIFRLIGSEIKTQKIVVR